MAGGYANMIFVEFETIERLQCNVEFEREKSYLIKMYIMI